MPAPPFTITIRDSLSELPRLAEAIEAHGKAHGWSEQWVFNLNLAFDELVTNVVNYGYDDLGPHRIRVTLTENAESLVAVLEDGGRPFDPFADAPEPDVDLELDDRPLGGLGVYLTRSIMDEVSYERRDNRNYVTLIQRAVK